MPHEPASKVASSVGLGHLDWIVIAAYALGMLAIGWYYSRRTKTTEDYLLGGRSMKPTSIGLSLFASLFSTISYLSMPGELIRYGPMVIIGTVVAVPPTLYVVGYLIIPHIMKLKVVSAYEILETRIGLSVRILGSVVFLVNRMVWMAVIVFATTDKVLVPLLDVQTSDAPYVSTVMVLLTVIYTSMGGLRAVVLTDVIQSILLFAGALLTIVLITHTLGGANHWWLTEWPDHWPEPEWGYDPAVRISFVGIAVASFFSWVCAFGSDQIAIQRYLATCDAKAARNALAWSLGGIVVVGVLLSLVGLALLAYFHANANLLASGQTLLDSSDQLFTRFIACGLPTGLRGLVVAGLLAAAMSSLSSGINSSCSVVTADFIDRFRSNQQTELNHLRLAKYISVAVGIGVVVLSSYISRIDGNLLEITVKIVNLPLALMFGLFFMALFVPWATSFGTYVGAVCGLSVASLISFWGTSVGISFIWGVPLGLLVQAVVGMLFSLLPIGRRPRGAETPSESDT